MIQRTNPNHGIKGDGKKPPRLMPGVSPIQKIKEVLIMKSHISAILIAFILIIAGCAGITYPEVSRLSEVSHAPLPGNAPILLSTKDIDQKYDEIAIINIRSASWTNIDKLNEALRQRARELGTNAVVRIQYGHEGMWGNPTATGVAVRIK